MSKNSDSGIQQRFEQLSRTVGELMEKAVQNERILRRYQQFELAMLSVSGLEPLLDVLLDGSRRHFQLDAAELWLLDRDATQRRLVEEVGIVREELRWLAEPAALTALYPTHQVSLASPPPAAVFRRRAVRSAALLPLIRRGQLIGSLHLGSFSPHRFTADKSTDFITHLGSIVAMCLENAVNQERLYRLSLVDPLTQVANRRAFELSLRTELARAARRREPLTLMLADIDHFKEINDQHGHQTGDMVLQQVAAQVQALLRQTDHICRYGGEEFAFILPACGPALAGEVAERIRICIDQLGLSSSAGLSVPVTISIGFSSWEQPDQQLDEQIGSQLLAAADRGLYRAKREGRNRTGFSALVFVAEESQE
ncbi:MAG: DUF484 family protein [Spongiibacteraceae bacterium]|nr:DUF484 family protein [Spongiibacteraceae bacterium]